MTSPFSSNYVPYDSKWDRTNPQFNHNARIATVAFESGKPFEFYLGDHYDPQIDIEGCLTQRGRKCFGRFSMFIGAPDLANEHRQKTPVQMERLYPFFSLEDSFHFALSNTPDPYALDYKLK